MYEAQNACLLPGSLTPECVTTSCELIIENDFEFRKFPGCGSEGVRCHLSHNYNQHTQLCLPEFECIITKAGKSEGDGWCIKTVKSESLEKDCAEGDCQAAQNPVIEDPKPEIHQGHGQKVLKIQT